MAADVCGSRGRGAAGFSVLLAIAAMLLSVVSCRQESGGPATKLAVERPATKPAPEHPAIDLPKLSGIAIDGDTADWADRGFVLGVMYSAGPRRLAAGQFDAQVRMGWDDHGLLLLADVTEPDIHESEDDLQLASGTSVEVTETDAKAKNSWHAFISPGVDPRHARMRTCFDDDRSRSLRTAKVSVTAAAKKTAHGYVLEALFPWDMLSIEPKTGSEIGLVVRINHPDGNQGADLEWSPGLTLANTKATPHVRLADAPSPAVTLVANGGYERFHRTRTWIAGTSDVVGKVAQIKMKDAVLGQATLQADGRLAVGQITLPMPAIGKPYGPLAVVLNGKASGTVAIANADDARKDAVAGLRVVAQPAVFTQTVLPGIEFQSPGAAEDLIGNYTLRTTYYDSDYNVVTSADHPGRYGAVVKVAPEHGKSFKRYVTLYRATKGFDFRPLELKAALQLPSKFGLDPDVTREQVTATGDLIAEEMRSSVSHDDNLAVYLAGMNETASGAGDLPRRLGPEGKNIAWWYGLKKKTGDLAGYKYLVHVPKLKKADPQAKFPLILFLHGSGERGNDLQLLKKHGPPKMLKEYPKWEFADQLIVVSPQCPVGENWNPLLLRDLLDEVSAKYPVDPDRVYLTGLSMGGFGTWELAQWFPERFAAVAPVCGGGDPGDVARLKEIPTWIFHGGRDPAVAIECAYEMVQAMRDVHARVRFTVYPECGHFAWVPTYDDPRFYQWLLEQRRGQPAQRRSETPDTRPAEE